jgi:hypothetical protein
MISVFFDFRLVDFYLNTIRWKEHVVRMSIKMHMHTRFSQKLCRRKTTETLDALMGE